ncbi:tyrosine-type recombinase/integrase [Methylobacterium sp. WL12]|uniref:tyrosine-type recombinase/integrase n=1 Tax=Methylobacterium sp. WL12 TaxID=2603890 RepID=UPI0011C7B6D2|nr:tyrosine-type recombinase/integrase [Methylobacterium sp. WL12]TXM72899.1 tyrosine-type recombinase/integrase [Methylobacterium sp. WL12]
MPRKLPPYVERNVVKGNTYLSFRRGKGTRIRLPADPTSTEFQDAYRAALIGQTPAKTAGRTAAAPGTIEALVQSYLRSPEYVELRATTKQGYRSRIEMIRTKHGHRTIAGLTASRISAAFLEPLAGKPGARLSLLKMLRILIRHAIGKEWLKHDPSKSIRRPKSNEIRSWTDEEIVQFEERWPVGSKQRLAFALHLYTGQRRSDVHRMTWADVVSGKIRVVQQKTGAKLSIYLHPDLRHVLDATVRQHVTILNTGFGKPFTVSGYGNWLRDAITDAGLPVDCQPHGLRKAAGRRLAEVGCSANVIMAVLGHKSLSEAERYTRDADQARLAEAGIVRLPVRITNNIAQTTPEEFGEVAKSKEGSKR